MHGFDYFVPHFITRVQNTRIVVTPNLISKVLHVPRVDFANYPGCDHLRIVSKDSSCIYSMRHPHLGVTVKTPLTRAL